MTGVPNRTALPATALMPWLVAAGFYVVTLLVGEKLLTDPDSYWHLVVGNWIVGHRAFPVTDPFSFTFNGQPWIAKEWLSQVLYAGAHGLLGWTGMAGLAAAAVAVAFGLLTRFLLDHIRPLPVLVFVAAAFMLTAPHLVARPHALALPVMVAWAGLLVRANDRGRTPSLWLLPLMTLWANLHGGFTLGLLLTGAIGLDAIVKAPPEARAATALRWVGFGAAALAAACITPYGPESILVTFRILGLGPALSIIAEWQPADFGRPGGLELVLLLGFGALLWRGLVLSPVRILTLLGLLHLALSAERNGEILGLVAPLLLAAPLAAQYRALAGAGNPGDGRGRTAGALIAAAAIVAATATLGSGLAPDPRITPAGAVAALKAASPGPVLNDYDFGGYLVYSGVPPFIDGRTELYGGNFVISHHRAVTLSDLPGLLDLLDRYRIGATLLRPQTPAVAYLDRSPGWRRLYADDTAVVHVRVK
ncbi:MAG TPA: hypothetical protein VFB16_13875 [Bauldia sp.]|nr:hypothetical protein [Bauldia sp.]